MSTSFPVGRSDNEFKGAVGESLPAQTKQHSVLEVENEFKTKQNKNPSNCIRGGASVPDVQKFEFGQN